MAQEESLFDQLSVQDFISDDDIKMPENEDVVDKVEPTEEEPPKEEPEEKPEEPQEKEEEPQEEQESEETEEKTEEDEDDQSVIKELKGKFGFDFEQDEFEESVDGIFELSRKAAAKMAETQLDEFFKQMPDVAEYAEYRMNGGDPSNYFEAANQTKDYSQVAVTEEDTATQRHIVDELLKRQGFDDDSRKTMLESMAKSGAMFEQAKAALPILSKLTASEKEKLVEQQREQASKMEAQRQQELDEIKSIVNAGVFKGIQVPEAEKRKFGSWLFQPDKDGKTGRNAAREQLSLEDKLALEYLVFKGFKLNEVIQKRVASEKAKDLKALIKDKQGSRMRKDTEERKTFDIPNVTDLFG